MTGHVTLSVNELERPDVLVRIAERRLTQPQIKEGQIMRWRSAVMALCLRAAVWRSDRDLHTASSRNTAAGALCRLYQKRPD
jgi:hypothetical protein